MIQKIQKNESAELALRNKDSSRDDFAYFNDNELLKSTLAAVLTMVCSDAEVTPETLVRCLAALCVNIAFFLHDDAASCPYRDPVSHTCLC